MGDGMIPEGERLARAIAWLGASEARSRERIEEAAARFGLSVLESAVLFRYFAAECPDLYDKDQ